MANKYITSISVSKQQSNENYIIKDEEANQNITLINNKIQNIQNNPTTLSDYGITDAKIIDGTIYLGNKSLTPLAQQEHTNLFVGNGLTPASSSTTEEEHTYVIITNNNTIQNTFAVEGEGGTTIRSDQFGNLIINSSVQNENKANVQNWLGITALQTELNTLETDIASLLSEV